jgi:hypothetical protein
MSPTYALMMRTTIRLDDDLLRAAKQRALERRSTLTAFIEQAVRTELRREEAEAVSDRPPFRITAFGAGTGGLRPAVDLRDNAALADVLDGDG